MSHKSLITFRTFDEFLQWFCIASEEKLKITESVKIVISDELIIYNSPLECLESHEEGEENWI